MSGKFHFKFHRSDQDPACIPWTDAEDPTTDRRVMIGYQWMSSELWQARGNDTEDGSERGEVNDDDAFVTPVRDVLQIKNEVSWS